MGGCGHPPLRSHTVIPDTPGGVSLRTVIPSKRSASRDLTGCWKSGYLLRFLGSARNDSEGLGEGLHPKGTSSRFALRAPRVLTHPRNDVVLGSVPFACRLSPEGDRSDLR